MTTVTLLHRPKSYALFSATIVARGASVSCLARPVTRNSAPTTKASILPLEMSKIIGSHVHLVCNDLGIIAYTFSGVGIISILSLCCNVVCYVIMLFFKLSLPHLAWFLMVEWLFELEFSTWHECLHSSKFILEFNRYYSFSNCQLNKRKRKTWFGCPGKSL